MKETTFRLAICACLAWGGGLSAHAAELAVAEDLKGFKVSDGLVLSVAVAEPHVAQPVYLTFDERGRMWVVQYLQYPFPAGLKVVGHDEYWRVKYDHWPPLQGAMHLALRADQPPPIPRRNCARSCPPRIDTFAPWTSNSVPMEPFTLRMA